MASLSQAMTNAKKNVHYCKECCTYTDQELCPICASDKRNHRVIMVVENPRDLAAYEKTGKFDGVYHVLHGAISPMLGIGPADIRLRELMVRQTGIRLPPSTQNNLPGIFANRRPKRNDGKNR